jgi:hypothetical protein
MRHWPPLVDAKRARDFAASIAKLNRFTGRVVRVIRFADACDLLTCVLFAVLVVVALFTVKDYAISNGEGVQQRYGELIIEYYRSGFRAHDLFTFQNHVLIRVPLITLAGALLAMLSLLGDGVSNKIRSGSTGISRCCH